MKHVFRTSLAYSTIAFAAADKSGAGKSAAAPTAFGKLFATVTPPASTVLEAGTITPIAKGIPIPVKVKKAGRGGSSPYDFDKMEVGDSFGIVGKTKKSIASTVFGANKRNSEPVLNEDGTPKTKVVEKHSKKTNTTTRETVPETRQLKTFEAFDVTEDTGVTVRVFRMA